MGLLGSKKIYVASTVQNMAGDELKRPNYLKTTVIGSVLGGREDVADTLQRAYLRGPGMKFRNFFRWSQREGNYEAIGVPIAKVGYINEISGYVLGSHIPVEVGQSVSVQSSEIGVADYSYWAEQYILENNYDEFDTDWSADISEETGLITIVWEDESITSFTPTDYNKTAHYIYAAYMTTESGGSDPLITGDTVMLDPEDEFPSTAGWILLSESPTEKVYRMETYEGTSSSIISGDKTTKLVETMYFFEDGPDRSYRIDQQRFIVKEWKGPKIFIYRIGSGNTALDDMYNDTDGTIYEGEFFPFIPIRLDNKFLSESYKPEAYKQAKKALKKAVNGKLDDIIEELSDAEALDDIDYAYAVFGVGVNVLDNSSRKYMYNFLNNLSTVQGTDASDYTAWKAAMAEFQESLTAWLNWKEGQGSVFDPDFGSDEPEIKSYPVLPYSKLTLVSDGTTDINYNVEISWQSISETTGTGLAKPDAKNNEVWFETIDVDVREDKLYYKNTLINVNNKNTDRMRLYWQIDENSWKALDIVGLIHKNYIYKNKYVEITLMEGVYDPEKSGFIIPLHYPTLTSMSLVDTTQMATACAYLVFNSYVVKKTGLLGSIFFKILLVAVIIVVVVYAPQLAPQLANAALSTGTALGFSGLTAAIVGAAVNAIAAMVLTELLMKASIAVFGEKLGLIIGTALSIAAMNGFQNIVSGQGVTLNFGNMMSAQNLTMLTSSIGNVYAKFVTLDAMETMGRTEELQERFNDKQAEISKLYADNFGYGNGVIDPLALLDSSNMLIETASVFLSRTLMTGTDIAEMSMDMIRAFPELTLSSDLPLN